MNDMVDSFKNDSNIYLCTDDTKLIRYPALLGIALNTEGSEWS